MSSVVNQVTLTGQGPDQDKMMLKFYNGNDYESWTYREVHELMSLSAYQHYESLKFLKNYNSNEEYMPVGFLSATSQFTIINMLGLMVLGLTPVALSPRNSVDILVNLLEKSKCRALVYSKELISIAQECQKLLPNLVLVPQNTDTEPEFKIIEPLFKHDDSKEHIATIFHTSGSTGYPKLIQQSNRFWKTVVNRAGTAPQFETSQDNILSLAPFFHVLGFSYLSVAIYNNATISLPSISGPVPPNILLRDIESSKATVLVALPFHLIHMASYCQEKNLFYKVETLKSIIYSGATLPHSVQLQLEQQSVSLHTRYGSTETGLIAIEGTGPNIILMSGLKYQLIKCDTENTCQIIISNEDDGLATGVSNQNGFSLGDLFQVIDESKREFLALGRTDDTIVHISGEKTNPVPIETEINVSPLIERCLVYGANKMNNCILIELSKQAHKLNEDSVMKEIHNVIDKANERSPRHSHIHSDFIFILPKGKSLPVTIKGNVQRHRAYQEYQDEIETIYSPDSKSIQIGSVIKSCFHMATNKSLVNDETFFEQGMDSLSAVKFTRSLQSKFSNIPISPNDIYNFDTITTLSNFIAELSGISSNETMTKSSKSPLSKYQIELDIMISQYCRFTENPSLSVKEPTNCSHILVTGANGALGNYLINSLLNNDSKLKIIALIRGNEVEEVTSKLYKSLQSRQIQISSNDLNRINCLPYQPKHPQLDLSEENWNFLSHSISEIYHVAWRMDFNQNLSNFQDCLQLTHKLLQFSSSITARFHFISSIGAALPTLLPHQSIKESILTTELRNSAFCSGYNLSKIAGETISRYWSLHYQFPCHIHRIGQICGDSQLGHWNIQEHIPLLIKGIHLMKMAPATFHPIQWIPIDVLTQVIIELSNSKPTLFQVHNICNPHITSWQHILSGLTIKYELVEWPQFLNTLTNDPKFKDVHFNPLATLTPFFKQLVATPSLHMITTTSQSKSITLQYCPAITNQDIQRFIDQWHQQGFLTLN